jgi:dTDP-4-amino-4,6-dideoxygalactose transaminase
MSDLAILGGAPTRTRPFPSWPQHAPDDLARLQTVLESGNWGGYPFPNRLANEFAQEFAQYHGAEYGCCVANGTIALVVAMQAAGIRYGDEVIVPAYTWDGTAAAVLFAGGVPVFADVDPDTYCLDVESVGRAITPRTRAIIPVHLAMRFAEMDALLDVAARHQLIVIEDCAHAHGGRYKDRGAGSMGAAGCFSFQSSKIMTSGEGGIVITSRLDLYEVIQSVTNCGRASITDQYKKRVLGSNYRITEFQVAILQGQLERLPELAARRVRNAALLTRRLLEIDGISPLPHQPGLTREAIYNYLFRYRRAEVPRDVFVAALDKEGIPCDGRFYEPVYRSDLFHAEPEAFPQLKWGREQAVDYRGCSCPVSERAAYHEAVWLPQFLLLGDEQDVEDIASAVCKVLTNISQLVACGEHFAGVKSLSRADRPRIEKTRNY